MLSASPYLQRESNDEPLDPVAGEPLVMKASVPNFALLSRERQCESVAKLAASRVSVEHIASMTGLLRATVAAMIQDHNSHKGRTT